VLAGGGAKGAYQVPWLEVMNPDQFDIVAGTSSGALNAILFRTGEMKRARQLSESLSFRSILPFRCPLVLPFALLSVALHYLRFASISTWVFGARRIYRVSHCSQAWPNAWYLRMLPIAAIYVITTVILVISAEAPIVDWIDLMLICGIAIVVPYLVVVCAVVIGMLPLVLVLSLGDWASIFDAKIINTHVSEVLLTASADASKRRLSGLYVTTTQIGVFQMEPSYWNISSCRCDVAVRAAIASASLPYGLIRPVQLQATTVENVYFGEADYGVSPGERPVKRNLTSIRVPPNDVLVPRSGESYRLGKVKHETHIDGAMVDKCPVMVPLIEGCEEIVVIRLDGKVGDLPVRTMRLAGDALREYVKATSTNASSNAYFEPERIVLSKHNAQQVVECMEINTVFSREVILHEITLVDSDPWYRRVCGFIRFSPRYSSKLKMLAERDIRSCDGRAMLHELDS
jgi:hypothetical protein